MRLKGKIVAGLLLGTFLAVMMQTGVYAAGSRLTLSGTAGDNPGQVEINIPVVAVCQVRDTILEVELISSSSDLSGKNYSPGTLRYTKSTYYPYSDCPTLADYINGRLENVGLLANSERFPIEVLCSSSAARIDLNVNTALESKVIALPKGGCGDYGLSDGYTRLSEAAWTAIETRLKDASKDTYEVLCDDSTILFTPGWGATKISYSIPEGKSCSSYGLTSKVKKQLSRAEAEDLQVQIRSETHTIPKGTPVTISNGSGQDIMIDWIVYQITCYISGADGGLVLEFYSPEGEARMVYEGLWPPENNRASYEETCVKKVDSVLSDYLVPNNWAGTGAYNKVPREMEDTTGWDFYLSAPGSTPTLPPTEPPVDAGGVELDDDKNSKVDYQVISLVCDYSKSAAVGVVVLEIHRAGKMPMDSASYSENYTADAAWCKQLIEDVKGKLKTAGLWLGESDVVLCDGKRCWTAKPGEVPGKCTSLLPSSLCENAEGEGIVQLLSMGLNILTAGVGILATIGLVISGIQYTAARDDAGKVAKVKSRIFNIVIGLLAYGVMWLTLEWLIPGGILHS